VTIDDGLIMKISNKLFVATLLALFVPKIYSASFDCAKASSRMEKLICSNADLSKLDEKLAEAYKAAYSKDKKIKANQINWLKETSKCGDESCLTDAYRQRIAALNVIGSTGHFSENKDTSTQNSDNSINPGETTWYAKVLPGECGVVDGPAPMIELLIESREKYRVIEDKKVGGKPMQVTLQIFSQGTQYVFYRDKSICDSAVSSTRARIKSETDKYR
jgi:uncharacterized protein